MPKKFPSIILIGLFLLVFGVWFSKNNPKSSQNALPTPTPIIKAQIGDKITVQSPLVDQIVVSPLIVTGKARGSWFFEAQAPIKLVDETGNLIANGIIKTDGDWQTDNFVPFSGKLIFEKPKLDKGVLILEKDNPSGKPENNLQLVVPVRFY